jgi:hypothetical protein
MKIRLRLTSHLPFFLPRPNKSKIGISVAPPGNATAGDATDLIGKMEILPAEFLWTAFSALISFS